MQNSTDTIIQIKSQLVLLFKTNIWALLFLLLLTDLNLIFEFLKWQQLVGIIKKISFLDAYQQCLSSLTASIFTPNRIGEYGVKAIYYSKPERKKILFLNLIGNLMQMLVTVLFGIIGILYFRRYFSNLVVLKLDFWLFFLGLLIILYLVRNQIGFKNISRIYLDKIVGFTKKISTKTWYTVFGYSLIRYIIFSHQFYFLLLLFNVEPDYYNLMYLIYCMYLLASIVPSFALFDWAIKGSVALFVFSFSEVNELTIVLATTLMWVLNVAIPSILGSFFVLNLKLDSE